MGVGRIITAHTLGSNVAYTAAHFCLPGGVDPDAAAVTDMAARVRAFWAATVGTRPLASVATVSANCDLFNITSGVLTGSVNGTAPAAIAGSASGDVLPLQTQYLLRQFTAVVVAGRRLRGRWFLPYPMEAANDSSGLATGTAAIATAANGMLTGTTAAQLVVWHRPVSAAGGVVAPVVAFNVPTAWSVQRSRRT